MAKDYSKVSKLLGMLNDKPNELIDSSKESQEQKSEE